jgi:hypothetical protein
MRWPAGALAPYRVFSNRQGGSFCRQRVQTGRRLMRQTVLPTMSHGEIAPTPGQCPARRFDSVESRSARRLVPAFPKSATRTRRLRRRDFGSAAPGLRFGLPLTPESGGPSRHAAARNARTVLRARRRQELQNAQQNAYRCHPPGGDPGGRGPRQSRRRI